MAWRETNVMDQKTEFVLRAVRSGEPFGELCSEFGISRKTGYKWKQRFLQHGLDGLHDQPRRPKSSPNGLSEDVVCRIVRLKQAHPSWGPRKLRDVMLRSGEIREIPSESSFKRVLDKAGLVKRRRRVRQRDAGRLQARVKSQRPNHVWTIDFKGWWRTRDRGRFEPLTVRDDYSRFILCARSLSGTRLEPVREEMHRLFARHGLPEIIRSDNGVPFAAPNSPFGLTRLSAWWLALGIDLDRIRPGKPQENGGHERMHRDIATELQCSAEATLRLQQEALDEWRTTFNQERPHEALGMRVPAEVYMRSPRSFDETAVELCYPPGLLVRRVYSQGRVKVRNMAIHLSESLTGYHVGLESLDAWRYSVWFSRLCLGQINVQTQSFRPGGG